MGQPDVVTFFRGCKCPYSILNLGLVRTKRSVKKSSPDYCPVPGLCLKLALTASELHNILMLNSENGTSLQ